jgi:hypothetical protein
VHGTKVLCDAAEADEVILHYIWRVPESQWPPWFREGMIRRWEAILLRGIGERHRGEERDKAAEDQFALARNRDSQSQTPRDPMVSPTQARRAAVGFDQPADRFPFRRAEVIHGAEENPCRPASRRANSRPPWRCGRTPINIRTARSRCLTGGC